MSEPVQRTVPFQSPMIRAFLLGLVLLAMNPGPVSGQPSPSSQPEVAEFNLAHVTAADAATTLRTIAGTLQIEIISEYFLLVHDTTEVLEVVRQTLQMIDREGESPGPASSFSVASDGSEVAAFWLQHASTPEVMRALRAIVDVNKIAATHQSSLVLIRDTPEKVESARRLVEIMDRACP